MQVHFWGVRGSLPTPLSNEQLRAKQRLLLQEATAEDLASDEAIDALLDRSSHSSTHGGNTSCVEVRCDDLTIILDAGSGIRGANDAIFASGRQVDHPLHILLTHFHWDHICGLPFFGPIYMPGRELNIWSWRDAADIERLLSLQMNDAHFPVKWDKLPSKRLCHQVDTDGVTHIGPVEVRCLEMVHPDGAYGYRLTHNGKSVCYLTDTEVSKNPNQYSEAYATFADGADLVIVDAMYGFLEYHEHYDFGHSSIYTWIDFFKDSNIGELMIFHHDPQASDTDLDQLTDSGRKYLELQLLDSDARWKLSAAAEGMVRTL